MASEHPGTTRPLDLLAGAAWECASSPPGVVVDPQDLEGADLDWLPAEVPGTVAGAVRRVGHASVDEVDFDGSDWWFRTRVTVPPEAGDGTWLLDVGGVATISDIWMDGHHLGHSDSMFSAHQYWIERPRSGGHLVIRCGALTPILEERRPRPRWKSSLLAHPNLRWLRTSLLGRQVGWSPSPPIVGPWRPIRLVRGADTVVVDRQVRVSCFDDADGRTTGVVSVELALAPGVVAPAGGGATLIVAGQHVPLIVVEHDGQNVLAGTATVEGVERWWPNGYGPQPLYDVQAAVAGVIVDLGQVGFRTIEVDQSDGAFTLAVNGTQVFCRGACWFPIDPVGLQRTDEELDAVVSEAAAAGWTMVRIPGGTAYEDERFFERCDVHGLLVWQDLMSAQAALPDDEVFITDLVAEAVSVASMAAAHPCLAVLCGGQQIEEQAAMQGLGADRWRSAVLEDVLPSALGDVAPGIPWVTSSPSGGDLPFRSNVGVSHFAAVGPLLRPLTDIRLATPRFASEGISFAIPPEPATVEETYGGAEAALAHPTWRMGAHRDAFADFDMVDVTDHYVQLLFDEDPHTLKRTDPERYLDLSRAVGVEVVEHAIADWRRPDSACSGALAIARNDLRPGPGWGLVDHAGRPKANWYALARVAAPVAVLCIDEGINGLVIHVVNDTGHSLEGVLDLALHTAAHRTESGSMPISVPARGSQAVLADALFDGFRDLTYAFRFGPRALEVVTAELTDRDGTLRAQGAYLPGGPARPVDSDLGLQVNVERDDEGLWLLTVSTQRFAQRVQVRVPGFGASDSWFHLAPGTSRTVQLVPDSNHGRSPAGSVMALNGSEAATVSA